MITLYIYSDEYQKVGVISQRNEIPMKPILPVEIFDVWGIDFIGSFINSNNFEYILLDVDYMSKWVEEIPTRTNDAKVVIKFMQENIIFRFGIPKSIISDGGSQFCNRLFEKLMQDNVIKHKVGTPYHPQTSGQAETSNNQIKSFIEKTVKPSRKGWPKKLREALWAHRTAYKTVMRTTPFQLVYGKSCHLPVEVEHKAYWAIKLMNHDLDKTEKHRKLHITELEELRDAAYENANVYKEKMKKVHDSRIVPKEFRPGMKVLLFNSRLKLFPEKLKSHWSGPFEIGKVLNNGAVRLIDPDTHNLFTVNGHHLKIYVEEEYEGKFIEHVNVAELLVDDPLNE